ncbi:hypothetical protein GCM10008986_09910 [Salinibacillus aidingensis]|uniref:Uncharacterized protein n=2 Tax=Salinibacillus aidingensis TaxID=237684 RepID=A0ABP3KTB7_9BACI
MLFLLERLSVKLILLGGSIGIFLNSLIDVYRQQYSLESINLIGVATNLVNNFFVFNTPVYAYHASATHVAAELLVTINDKINSFFMFLSHIFLGASNDMGDVTHYVKEHYFYNHGGGLIPSHFYFWLGWLGVILISVIVVIILNKLGSRNNHYLKIVTVTIIFSVPRWYLYTPLSLVRPVLIVSVLFIIFNIVHHIIKGSVGEQKNIDSSSLSVKNIQ